jgi:ubiquinone/menaquinone biosynthesis C-methylase UbiE
MTRAAVRGALTALLLLLTAGQTFAQQDRGRRLFRPEELGELEGPDRDAWQKPDLIMDALRVGEGSVVADVGAGGGWFTVRLARRVGPRNVKPVRGEADDPKLPSGALDAALIVDSYHEFPRPIALLSKLAASLKPGGRIGIVNFTKDGGGPGPPMSDRPDPQKVIDEAGQAGLRLVSRESFLDFQYLLIFGR